jgi:hypothetical protein
VRDRSREIIKKFADHVGVSIYKRRKSGNFYDPVTGIYMPVFDNYPVLIAYDVYSDTKFPGLKAENGMVVGYVSGQDLDFEPTRDDLIENFDGITFTVFDYTVDMYKYVYTISLKAVNEG